MKCLFGNREPDFNTDNALKMPPQCWELCIVLLEPLVLSGFVSDANQIGKRPSSCLHLIAQKTNRSLASGRIGMARKLCVLK